MEKPPVNTTNKAEISKTEQSAEHFSFSEQEKNIQEVFKLSPELKEIAYQGLGIENEKDVVIEIGRNKENTLGKIQNINVYYKGEKIIDSDGQDSSKLYLVTKEDGTSYIGDIFLPRELQGQGLAKKILQQVSDNLDTKIVPTYLSTGGFTSDNAKKMWEKIGNEILPNHEAEKLYAEYLKTIFPESKVQDIVWHGTDNKNVSDILINNFADDQTEKGLSIKNATFFAREYNAYGNDAYGSNDKTLIPALVNVHRIQLQEESMTIADVNSLYKDNADALLQISFDVNSYKNGEKLSFEELENIRTKLEENGLNEIVKNTNLEKSEVIKILEDENKRDSFLENYVNQFGIKNIPFGQLAVKPEQVHILGSKADIEKFKEFVSKS